MSNDFALPVRIIESSASLQIALFNWLNAWGLSYQQNCIQSLCGDNQIQLEKHQSGQPFLLNSRLQVSLSHTGEILAVSCASDPQPGVDIEQLRDKIRIIAHRVFHADELDCIAGMPVLPALHLLWGAKEAIYKSYGQRGLNFINDIRVLPFVFHPESGDFRALLHGNTLYLLRYQFFDDNKVIVYTTGIGAII